MRKLLFLSTAVVPLLIYSAPAEARIRGGIAAAAPEDTCPNGTANAAIDGCEDAHLDATFRMSDMDDYFRDNDGNIATLAIRPGHAPGVPSNVAGRDFPIGPRYTTFKDPANYYFATSSSNVNGTTYTATTVTAGTVFNGAILWSSPSSSGLLTNHPVLSNCTGGVDGSHPSGGGSGTVCTLSISQSNKTGPYKGSHAAGCSWVNGGAGVSAWTCDFRYPNQALTADFDNFDFGATGGHTSTTLLVNQRDNGVPTLKVTNSRIIVDAQTNGQTIIRSNPGIRVNAVVEDNLFDGGNASVATGEGDPFAFNFRIQSGGFGWGGEGISGDPITVSFKRNWIQHWAGNPIQISAAYATVTSQANVFYRIGMNNGNNTAGGQTGLHGASINWNTTAVGATGTIKRYNDVVIYPYGSRPGVTTAPFAVLGGIGSAITTDYDQQLTTSIVNAAQPGQAISSEWVNLLRQGAISNLNIKNNYVSTVGIANGGCFAAGGDVNNGNITASMAKSAGNKWSLWTVSGIFTAAKEKPLPGQAMSVAPSSSTRSWFATFTDLLNGTSRMDITLPVVNPTNDLAAGWQIVGLGLADQQTNPTLIVSGSGTSYIVSDGTGSGRNLSGRFFQIAFVIQPYGTNGTTATGGATPTDYNGTYSLAGEENVASTNSWNAIGVKIGNYATITSDVANNYDVLSGSSLTVDGNDLGHGSCPGTNPG